MRESQGFLVGTAGHIDHGKTTLIGALTGIDTDRLAEEKRRGISIDLGFAHLTLASGALISFIDVPGHERFVKNMLAGVGGIQAVLLVVAANESVMPQTREHFAICRLLGIQHGLIALTKVDLASPEEIEITREEVADLCAGSFLEGAPVIEVSGRAGVGLETLRDELRKMAARVRPRETEGVVRLPIDRSFASRGFGTVVTGTLWNGTLSCGDSVLIHPVSRTARIRGLQVHGKPVESAVAGQRTAVNLTGIDHAEIERGFLLTHSDPLQPTTVIDASVSWLPGAGRQKARQDLMFYMGTAEVNAKCKLLVPDLVRLTLAEPVIAFPGDRFILRRPSPPETVAGGSVIDAFPPGRLTRVKTVARLRVLKQTNLQARVEFLVEESRDGVAKTTLAQTTGLTLEQMTSLVAKSGILVIAEPAGRVVSKAQVATQAKKLSEWLQAFHKVNPTLAGAPIASARLTLEPAVAELVFNSPAFRVQSELISLATHQVQASSEESDSLQKIERAFRQAGMQPPSAAEVLKNSGADPKSSRRLLESLVKSQKLIRVSEDLIFHSDIMIGIRKTLAVHKGKKFSVPEFKDWTQISRKYAIPLLEYLDRQHVTRREGDSRVVL